MHVTPCPTRGFKPLPQFSGIPLAHFKFFSGMTRGIGLPDPVRTRNAETAYNLRPRAHSFELPEKDDRNFISRLLFSNIYWVWVRQSQGQPLPGSTTPKVRHSQGEPLYTVSEHFINPTRPTVSANHYFFSQFQLLLAL